MKEMGTYIGRKRKKTVAARSIDDPKVLHKTLGNETEKESKNENKIYDRRLEK